MFRWTKMQKSWQSPSDNHNHNQPSNHPTNHHNHHDNDHHQNHINQPVQWQSRHIPLQSCFQPRHWQISLRHLFSWSYDDHDDIYDHTYDDDKYYYYITNWLLKRSATNTIKMSFMAPKCASFVWSASSFIITLYCTIGLSIDSVGGDMHCTAFSTIAQHVCNIYYVFRLYQEK